MLTCLRCGGELLARACYGTAHCHNFKQHPLLSPAPVLPRMITTSLSRALSARLAPSLMQYDRSEERRTYARAPVSAATAPVSVCVSPAHETYTRTRTRRHPHTRTRSRIPTRAPSYGGREQLDRPGLPHDGLDGHPRRAAAAAQALPRDAGVF